MGKRVEYTLEITVRVSDDLHMTRIREDIEAALRMRTPIFYISVTRSSEKEVLKEYDEE